LKENLFEKFRGYIGNGAGMSDLQVVLETARHELVCADNLYCCDRVEKCPHCENCKRGSWILDTTKSIQLIDAAIKRFCRPSGIERQKEIT
jgi:hypothetical protein